MRYHVKGGIWKNTEDEILKAAVMKYGLNQWSRISSLLVRKSAKQCKERWYEWLDPKIKKTEWTKDEEEKLLQLAKMFPCQWKTIAPFVGRTAYQCIEHYEYLLDKAQGRENDPNDPRKLRPGEIDPNPEAKPARPDPIDLDEDTKETLNEARARVANTRGKKAKRKIREKQLEEARRLAALQKKRELKSAGIEIVLRLPKKKKKEMNYNTDIPFMREVPKGSFSDELEQTPEPNKFKGGISLQYLENRNRDIEEEKQRKLDEKRMKNLKQKDLPKAIEMINKMNDPMNMLMRNKINLPDPQITENDLKEISKLTSTSASTGANMLKDPNKVTDILMGDYSQLRENQMSSLRTPQTENKILTEARIAASLKEGDTPLLGGEGSKKDLDFYLSYRNDKGSNSFKTPLPINISSSTPGIYMSKYNNDSKTHSMKNSTPMRDEMGINNDNYFWENDKGVLDKQSIRNIFDNLPKPKNTFELNYEDFQSELDELRKDKENDEDKRKTNEMIEKDAEEVEIELKIKEREEKERQMQLYTDVIKKGLPRVNLTQLNINAFLNSGNENNSTYISIAEEMVKEEIIKLIKKDNKDFPFKGMVVSDEMEMEDEEGKEEGVGREERELIEQLINEEEEKINCKESVNEMNKIHDDLYLNNLVFINKDKGYCYKENAKFDKVSNYEEDFNIRNMQLLKENALNKKLKQKGDILTKGLKMNYDKIQKEFIDLIGEISELREEKSLYENMLNEEGEFFKKRKNEKEKELQKLNDYESILQSKYKQIHNK